MLAEVTTRFLSNFLPSFLDDLDRLGVFLLSDGGIVPFGSAMTLRVGGHIRVVISLENAPAPIRRALDILSALAGFAFMAF